MTAAPFWITEIETRSRGLPVLLVEGKSDVLLFNHFLDQRAPDWRLRLYLAAAGKKQHVISCIKNHQQKWIGVVDCDEWSQEDLATEIEDTPHLHQLPRYCLESYFCHPDELGTALPDRQKAKVNNDKQGLAKPIFEALPGWVVDGAIWRLLRRAYHAMLLPKELNHAPITDEGEIYRILQTWHAKLDPDEMMERYHNELSFVRQQSPDEQLYRYIRGKEFYNQVVVAAILNPLFGQRSGDAWQEEFLKAPMLPPPDIQELLAWILDFV